MKNFFFKLSKNKHLAFLIIFTFFLNLFSSGCMATPALQSTPTDTVTPSSTITITPSTTPSPTVTKTKSPTATPQPTAISYQIPAMPGATLLASDLDGDEEWDEMAQVHARNLALPQPYHYEFFELPSSASFSSVFDYYSKHGAYYMRIDDINNILLLNGDETIDGIGKISLRVHYWIDADLLLIFYVMPDEGSSE